VNPFSCRLSAVRLGEDRIDHLHHQAGSAIGADVFVKVESGRLVLEVIDPQAKAAWSNRSPWPASPTV
jgi:hypothetical protein